MTLMSLPFLHPIPRAQTGSTGWDSRTSLISGGSSTSLIDAKSYVRDLSASCNTLLKERIRERYGGKKLPKQRRPYSVSLNGLCSEPIGTIEASSGGVSNQEALTLYELKDIILDNSEMSAEQPQLPSGDGLLKRAKLCLHRLRASGLDDGPDTILKRGRAALAIARFIVDDPHSSDKDIALALTEFTWAVTDADEALKRMRKDSTDGAQSATLLREAAELAVLTRVEYADFLCTMSCRETLESRRLRKHALLLCRVLKDADGQPLLQPDSLARRLAEESQGTTFYSTNAFSSVTLSSGEINNRPKLYPRQKRG